MCVFYYTQPPSSCLQIASARAGTGRARYYGAAIGLLNEPQLRQMVGDLVGPQVGIVPCCSCVDHTHKFVFCLPHNCPGAGGNRQSRCTQVHGWTGVRTAQQHDRGAEQRGSGSSRHRQRCSWHQPRHCGQRHRGQRSQPSQHARPADGTHHVGLCATTSTMLHSWQSGDWSLRSSRGRSNNGRLAWRRYVGAV